MVFGLDFEAWYQRGCWSDRYICYSFSHHDRVVANASVNLMDIVIDDKLHRAIQIGTVMTDPEYRNQGLSRQLVEKVMADYRGSCCFMYLYANESVLHFYPKFGFERVIEPRYSLSFAPIVRKPGKLRKLNVHDEKDWELLNSLCSRRKPLSNQCSVVGAEGIFTWYCLNIFHGDLYYVEELEAIVIYRQEGNVLHLYDVVSAERHRLWDVLNLLPAAGADRVEVHFQPDEADELEFEKTYDESGDPLFVYPASQELISSNVKLPKIAQA